MYTISVHVCSTFNPIATCMQPTCRHVETLQYTDSNTLHSADDDQSAICELIKITHVRSNADKDLRKHITYQCKTYEANHPKPNVASVKPTCNL